MARANKKNRNRAYGSDWDNYHPVKRYIQDHNEHNYNDDWDYTGRSGKSGGSAQNRREQWDQNDMRDEYGDSYAYQNMDEPSRNSYSGSRGQGYDNEDARGGRRRRRRDYSYGADNMSNPQYNSQYDEFGSQTGNKRVEKGEYGRSRYGYGNDRNQPMEEFAGINANRSDEDWNDDNSYYQSNRKKKHAEYGQEGFADGRMKSSEEKRRLNIYNQDYRDMGEERRRRDNEGNYASRWGRGPEYGLSDNAIPGRNRSGGGQDYKDHYDSQRGSGSHYERREGHGGHGDLFGRGDTFRETMQGRGKGGSQFSGRNNEDYDDYDSRDNEYRSSRNSSRNPARNENRGYGRDYENDNSYPEGFDERDEYGDDYRPRNSRNDYRDKYNRH